MITYLQLVNELYDDKPKRIPRDEPPKKKNWLNLWRMERKDKPPSYKIASGWGRNDQETAIKNAEFDNSHPLRDRRITSIPMHISQVVKYFTKGADGHYYRKED